jgi:hypothetical protein
MANDSSLGAAETQAFDLETQQGVMHLLASIRASEIDGDQKNELRDLVFEYTNGGRDETVRLSLMQKVAAYGVTPVAITTPAPEVKVEPAPQYEFGTSRPSPSFAPPTVKAASAPQRETPQSTPQETQDHLEQPAPKTEIPSEAVVEASPVNLPVAEPQPAPAVRAEPAPAPAPSVATVEPSASKPEPAAQLEQSEPGPSVPPSPAPTTEPETQAQPDTAVEEKIVPPVSTPDLEPEPEPEPAPAPVEPPAAPKPEPMADKPVTPPAPEPTPAAAAMAETMVSPGAATSEQSLQRIREIKSIVNDRVGNPVNLVDINNEVGREYMAALLDAMKKLNNGVSSASAMQRLEAAFSAVEQTLDERDEAPVAPPEPAPAPAPATAPAAESPAPEPMSSAPTAEVSPMSAGVPDTPQPETVEAEPSPVPPEPVPVPPKPAPAPAPEPPKPDPVPEPPQAPPQPETPPAAVSATTVPVPPANQPSPQGVPNVPPAPQDSSTTVTVEPPKIVPKGAPAPQSKQLTPKEVASAWGPETDTVRPKPAPAAAPAPQSITPKAASLAQSETKLRTPDDLPLASSLETSSVAGDPLYTRQVDEGLEQLLSEWSLFKKSGLFGTGPKGREHPLFKKIADLQIPLLLAGRFEGATQEIKQSITDYMNGWRYEQGIIYEQGETFEHYLRRVIRHILDLQQGATKG